MKKKLFLFNILIVCSGIIAFFLFSIAITYSNNIEFAKDTVMNYAKIYQNFYDQDMNLSDFAKAPEDVRVTIISSDGTVIKDSKPLDEANLQNHIDRQEIQSALKNQPKVVVRYSETVGMDLMYYAAKVTTADDYVFIRTSTPIVTINNYLLKSLPLLFLILVITIGACAFLSNRVSKKLLAPFSLVKSSLQSINDGVFKKTLANSSYEEINQITNEINDISVTLKENITGITEEKNKLNYVLDNINDGLFAINKNNDIILINHRIKQIFEVTDDAIGHNISYLTIDSELSQNINNCILNNQNFLFEFKMKEHYYLVTIKNMSSSWTGDKGSLCVVIFSDITEAKNSQRQREEFFANASHELKTPLTVIKGFSELLELNNKDENLNKYTSGIVMQTDRMLSLISDMLKLSELESQNQLNVAKVSLASIANEVCESLTAISDEKNIAIKINGEGFVQAENSHIYELIKNLVENAMKYNKQNGKVNIDIVDTKKTVSLTVSDTGIGISATDQSRIFERFYRVEKSRSRINGGTGLGLSIVKHICSLYHATLSLKSKLGIGTEITVVFKSNS